PARDPRTGAPRRRSHPERQLLRTRGPSALAVRARAHLEPGGCLPLRPRDRAAGGTAGVAPARHHRAVPRSQKPDDLLLLEVPLLHGRLAALDLARPLAGHGIRPFRSPGARLLAGAA